MPFIANTFRIIKMTFCNVLNAFIVKEQKKYFSEMRTELSLSLLLWLTEPIVFSQHYVPGVVLCDLAHIN